MSEIDHQHLQLINRVCELTLIPTTVEELAAQYVAAHLRISFLAAERPEMRGWEQYLINTSAMLNQRKILSHAIH